MKNASVDDSAYTKQTSGKAEAEDGRPGSSRARVEGLQTISQKFDSMIGKLPDGRVTFGEIRDVVEEDGVLVLTIFLSIIFMIPVSIPGVSTVFGAAILLVGICRVWGRKLWLPEKLLVRELEGLKVKSGFIIGRKWVVWLEKVSRAGRMGWLIGSPPLRLWANLALILGALLLMAPFGFIPFSNTLPALALILLAMGMLQSDGRCIILGHITNLLTIAYFLFIVLGGLELIKLFWGKVFG